MKVQQVYDWLNSFAPFDSAENFDNVGLLMGDPEAEVTTVVFGMDLTEALAQEAIQLGAELIVTHHPFIFHPLKRIRYNDPQGRLMMLLMQHRINVMAAHTNYDKAPGGISDSLANALGLQEIAGCDDYVRIGNLSLPHSIEDLAAHISVSLHVEPRCYPASGALIHRVAVSGGAYGEGYEAALSSGAQAFVVGEIAHHEILDANARGLTVYDAGHFPTELPGVVNLYQRFLVDAALSQWEVNAHLHQQAPYKGALLAF